MQDPFSIWMTGDPAATHLDCCIAGNPEVPCQGVMIEVHFGVLPIVYICRRHLDVFGDMIVHTRKLQEFSGTELRQLELEYEPHA